MWSLLTSRDIRIHAGGKRINDEWVSRYGSAVPALRCAALRSICHASLVDYALSGPCGRLAMTRSLQCGLVRVRITKFFRFCVCKFWCASDLPRLTLIWNINGSGVYPFVWAWLHGLSNVLVDWKMQAIGKVIDKIKDKVKRSEEGAGCELE